MQIVINYPVLTLDDISVWLIDDTINGRIAEKEFETPGEAYWHVVDLIEAGNTIHEDSKRDFERLRNA